MSTPTPWDHLRIGGPYLPDDFFGGGHVSDWSKPLAGGIIGTEDGFDGDPFNFTYPTDGDFKLGTFLQCHQLYATGYHYPLVSDMRNRETQHYPHFNGRGIEGANPDPLELFEARSDRLVMKARPSTEEERATWCRVKGFDITPTGAETTYGYYEDSGIEIPMDWAPQSITGGRNSQVFFNNMPSPYVCPMTSTYNRRAMSFGRSQATVIMPSGAKGTPGDLRSSDIWFPAFWDLEDVPARCDLNGRLHNLDTHTPGNPAAQGLLNELDQVEVFGYELTAHITSHIYREGNPIEPGANVGGIFYNRTQRVQRNYNDNDRRLPDIRPPIPKGVPVQVGVDRLPPIGTTPGKIVYHIDGRIIDMFDMPEYLGNPKIHYKPVDGIPYLPEIDDDGYAVRLGSQLYENGQPAYTHFCQIFNIAMNAAFVRSQAQASLILGTAPEFLDEEEMHILETRMQPLLVENPDSRPFIDYTAGEFGGSHPTEIGPVIELNSSDGVDTGNGGDPVTPVTPPQNLTPRSIIGYHDLGDRTYTGGRLFIPRYPSE